MRVEAYHTSRIRTNTYLAIDDETKKAFIVDPGGECGALEKQLADEGLDPQWIILTHGHWDHIDGVARLKKLYPSLRVAACAEEKEYLSDPVLNHSVKWLGRPVTVEPDLWVREGDTLTVGTEELLFLETPGHTNGGMSVYVAGVLFSGDTLFYQTVGRTDLEQGSFPKIKKSITEKLFRLPDSTPVFPGHGQSTTIGDEKRYNPYVI